MLKKLLATASVAAAVAGSVLVGASGVQASEADTRFITNCPSGQFCLAPQKNFIGTGFGSANDVHLVPSYINDKAQSAFNHGTKKTIWAYSDKDFGGKRLIVGVGSAFGDLSQQGIANQISSFLWR